ncbi:MAG: hypothetical protein AB7O26_19200 [Planctomycetaceae bacterium]
MIIRKSVLSACAAMLFAVAPSYADELEKIDAEVTQRVGQGLVELFNKETKDPQVKFEGNPEKAVGLHLEREGIIMVPIKTLKEGELDPAIDSENGAGLCYIFMSKEFNPLVDGKPADPKKLRTVKFDDHEGNSREATALLVTARRIDGEDYRLYVFGADKKPLVESRWGESTANTEGDLAMTVTEAKDKKANLVLTLYNKYSASFEIAHK